MMDLERLLTEPPIGEIQFSASRPLESSVREVTEEVDLAVERDDLLSQLELLSSFVREDFTELISEEELEEWSSALVDAEKLDLESYQGVMVRVRSAIASSLMLSLVRQTERLTGVPYTGGSVSSYYSRIFDDWNFQWASVIRETLLEGVRSFHDAFNTLLSGGSQVVTEPDVELQVRDMESQRSQLEDRAYRRGFGTGRRLPDQARQLIRVCDALLDFLQLVLNGLDVMIGVSAVRVLSAFRGWREQLRERVESIARNQVADLLAIFGRNVVDPLFRRFMMLRQFEDVVRDLFGDLEELRMLDYLSDQIEDWWNQYNRWVYSFRDGMRRSFRFGVELSVSARRYDVLYRRRRICVVLIGVISSFRSGLIDGLSRVGE